MLAAAAVRGLEAIFRQGYAYSKAEVLLMDLRQRGEFTGDLFAAAVRPSADRLMAVVDKINGREGRGTVRLTARTHPGHCGVVDEAGDDEPAVYDEVG